MGIAGLKNIKGGDNRYMNNIFVGGVANGKNNHSGMGICKKAELPMYVDGNVYLNNAEPFDKEPKQLILDSNPEIKLEETDEGVFLTINIDKQIIKIKNKMVNTELLGKALIPDLPFVNPDNSQLQIDKDFFGNYRNKKNPTAGPFEKPEKGTNSFKVWYKQ
jgi:alpha-N-arabinofuranosidase